MSRLVSARTLVMIATALAMAACKGATAPKVVYLRIETAATTQAAVQELQVTAAIDNRGDGTFRSGGCLRPEIVIDSLNPTGTWVPLGVLQSDDLATCVTVFTVGPGQVQQFRTSFTRADPALKFPRGVPLRLRTVPVSLGDAPAVRFALP